MASASTQPACGSTARTSRKALTSSRRLSWLARSRKRLEVSFVSATAPLPCLSCAVSASFFLVCGLTLVDEVPGHWIVVERDIALGEHDLEEVGAPGGRAEHLGAAVEVDAPDAPEALVEALRVERLDALPVVVEALAPFVERQRVVPAQVLHVEHLEAGPLHLDDHVGEARDPAAGEHVLADEVVGLGVTDVSDEVDQPEAARLERARVRADQIGEAIAPGVLEAADRHHLVVLAIHAAEIGLQRHRVAQPLALDLLARVLYLRAGGVVAGDLHPPAL